jgi:hypothetical protein
MVGGEGGVTERRLVHGRRRAIVGGANIVGRGTGPRDLAGERHHARFEFVAEAAAAFGEQQVRCRAADQRSRDRTQRYRRSFFHTHLLKLDSAVIVLDSLI